MLFRRPRLSSLILLAMLAALGVHGAAADTGLFDLVGPTLDVQVTRGARTLPLTKVPNLLVGDRLLLTVELPATQSAHYLMIAAFLRGPTNPPPASWFHRCDTWTRKCQREGLILEVPAGAEQLLLFLAPETGGDFKTLVSTVRGRPGAFVRASQELSQAALDRRRLERYLAGLRDLNADDPAAVKEAAPLLARSLAIRVDEKCLDRMPSLQAPCLMQKNESLILNDEHSASMVAMLTSGAASDLAMQAGNTAALNSGAYSPYIGSVFDIARLLDSFHTARYQYIPALTAEQGDHLALMLNTPPSFHDPQSVLVAALPPIEPAQRPPLRAVDPSRSYCVHVEPLVLPVDGAPLVFATAYAHELTLEVPVSGGGSVALPARADPRHGGLLIDSRPLAGAAIDDHRRASLHGYWGFESFDGPEFQLANPVLGAWALVAGDEAALIVGREDTVRIRAANVSCVAEVTLVSSGAELAKVPWKAVKGDELELRLPLQSVGPGMYELLVKQFGVPAPQRLDLHTFADAGHLETFVMHAGDSTGVLKGTRLEQVVGLSLDGVEFTPAAIDSSMGRDELRLTTSDPRLTVPAGAGASARVRLKDGRTLPVAVSVTAPRPRGSMIAKTVHRADTKDGTASIELANTDELPIDAQLTFSVRAQQPATFGRDTKIEVATEDLTSSALLTLANGGVTLADARVAIATLDPLTALGSSAFGAVQFRLIADGTAGDWQRLATLVRLPLLRELQCPGDDTPFCQLSGSRLYLIAAVAKDARFRTSLRVADGYSGTSLRVPRPAAGRIYLKLRDDPTVVNSVVFAPRADTRAPPAPALEPGVRASH